MRMTKSVMLLGWIGCALILLHRTYVVLFTGYMDIFSQEEAVADVKRFWIFLFMFLLLILLSEDQKEEEK